MLRIRRATVGRDARLRSGGDPCPEVAAPGVGPDSERAAVASGPT